MKRMSVSEKRMLTERLVLTTPEGSAGKTVREWIIQHPDKIIHLIWKGHLQLTRDAHKLLMQELSQRFPNLHEQNYLRKKDAYAKLKKEKLLRIRKYWLLKQEEKTKKEKANTSK